MLENVNNEYDPCTEHGFFHLDRPGGDGSVPVLTEERFGLFLEECADVITAAAGEGNYRGLFLCGSFASGEGSVAFDAEKTLIISDIDLVLVVEDGAVHRRVLREKEEVISRCEGLLTGAKFHGHVDIAVRTPEELEGLERSPGVYDMRKRGIMLAGDPRTLELLPDFGPGEVNGGEGAVLLENRIVSLLGNIPARSQEIEERCIFSYHLSRAYTDILTALLCLERLYRPGYLARMEYMLKNGEREPLCRLIGEDLAEKIRKWTYFKITPGLNGSITAGDDAGMLWLDAVSDTLTAWRTVEYSLQGAIWKDRSPPAETILRSRKRGGWKRSNLRGWRAFLRSLPPQERWRAAAALGTVIFCKTPHEFIREQGVRLADLAVSNGIESNVRGAGGGFPYSGGNWRKAAARLHSTWRQLVFGRSED